MDSNEIPAFTPSPLQRSRAEAFIHYMPRLLVKPPDDGLKELVSTHLPLGLDTLSSVVDAQKTVAELSDLIDTTPPAINGRLERLYRVFGVHSILQAALVAEHHNLIEPFERSEKPLTDHTLTRKQLLCMQGFALGVGTKHLMRAINLENSTIQGHLTNARVKTGHKHASQLAYILWAIRSGIVLTAKDVADLTARRN